MYSSIVTTKANTNQVIRSDGRCGSSVPLDDGSPAQCDPKQNITVAQNGVIVEAQMSIVIVQIVLIIAKMMHQVYNACHLTIFKMSIRIIY